MTSRSSDAILVPYLDDKHSSYSYSLSQEPPSIPGATAMPREATPCPWSHTLSQEPNLVSRICVMLGAKDTKAVEQIILSN
jgi:hypothetical protein